MNEKTLPPNTLQPSVNLKRKLNVTSEEIILLRADVNYTEIFFTNGEKIILSKTLKELERKFNLATDLFFRTHKSFLINLSYIQSFQPNDSKNIRLINDEIAILSRRKKDAFLEVIRKKALI
jgi:DNA-binding LytR/AlgR family response regulator